MTDGVTALFDIDGVLLLPGGYRAATQATLRHFLEHWGAQDVRVPETALELFESMGVTSECDMIPLCLAIVLESAIEKGVLPITDNGSLAQMDGRLAVMDGVVDFDGAIRALQNELKPGQAAADCILDAALNGGGVFPSLHSQPVLVELLTGTRDVSRSATTRLLQNFVLGSRRFEATTGLKATVDGESYLEQFDRVAVGAAQRETLIQMRQNACLKTALFTARASLPPDGLARQGYFPEAEIARALLGLEDWPLVAYGLLQYMAECSGWSAERLLKPAPFQALVALGAAWSGDRIQALAWAGRLMDLPGCDGHAGENLNVPERGEVHVFEDSPVGLRAARTALDLLAERGYCLTAHFWGVARNADKRRALQEQGAQVFDDINGALNVFFRLIAC